MIENRKWSALGTKNDKKKKKTADSEKRKREREVCVEQGLRNYMVDLLYIMICVLAQNYKEEKTESVSLTFFGCHVLAEERKVTSEDSEWNGS